MGFRLNNSKDIDQLYEHIKRVENRLQNWINSDVDYTVNHQQGLLGFDQLIILYKEGIIGRIETRNIIQEQYHHFEKARLPEVDAMLRELAAQQFQQFEEPEIEEDGENKDI